MTPDDFKALLEQMEERLSGQLEDLNDANQELIRQLNEREEGPPQMETLALPASNDVETVRMHEGYINRDFEESNSFVSPIGVDFHAAAQLFERMPEGSRKFEYLRTYSIMEYARKSGRVKEWAGFAQHILEGLMNDYMISFVRKKSQEEGIESELSPLVNLIPQDKKSWLNQAFTKGQLYCPKKKQNLGYILFDCVTNENGRMNYEPWTAVTEWNWSDASMALTIHDPSSQNKRKLDLSRDYSKYLIADWFNLGVEALLVPPGFFNRHSVREEIFVLTCRSIQSVSGPPRIYRGFGTYNLLPRKKKDIFNYNWAQSNNQAYYSNIRLNKQLHYPETWRYPQPFRLIKRTYTTKGNKEGRELKLEDCFHFNQRNKEIEDTPKIMAFCGPILSWLGPYRAKLRMFASLIDNNEKFEEQLLELGLIEPLRNDFSHMNSATMPMADTKYTAKSQVILNEIIRRTINKAYPNLTNP